MNFIRTTGDVRLVLRTDAPTSSPSLHVQGGYVTGWGDKDLRMLDHFQMGPNLVRGFATAGIGPRDLTIGTYEDALGGTTYWGASFEAQGRSVACRRISACGLAVFADAGSVWNYTRSDGISRLPARRSRRLIRSQASDTNAMTIRSSVGAGMIWDSPFGPIRIDYAFPLTKDPNDRVQELRFSGGTKF